MKISNEIKVGILATIGIAILVLGYSYLKGEDLLSSSKKYYALYPATGGLEVGNDILYKGFSIGTISNVERLSSNLAKEINLPEDSSHLRFRVTLRIDESDMLFPEGTKARLSGGSVLSSTHIELIYPDTIELKRKNIIYENLKPYSYLEGAYRASEIDAFVDELSPVRKKFIDLIESIDQVALSIQSTFDSTLEQAIGDNVESFRVSMKHIQSSAENIDEILKQNTPDIKESIENIKYVTKNLRNNEAKIDSIFTRLDNISRDIERTKIQKSFGKLDTAITDFASVLNSLNSDSSSLGLLLNNRDLYDKLFQVSSDLDSLIIDARAHPSRYFRIRFGDKD